MKKYPDINRLLRHKDEHRRALAALPFEKKIEMVFRINERRVSIKRGGADKFIRSSSRTK